MELDLEKIFSSTKMTFRTYLIVLVISIVLLGLVLPNVLIAMAPEFFTGLMSYMVYIIPILLITIVASIPFVLRNKDQQEIEKNMPLFVTRMAALSTSELPMERIFEILSQREEYGRLAKDSGRIHKLIKDYHLGASEACQLVASKSPSSLEADFLLRLAHSLEVGEKLDRFLKNEQDVTMDEYILKCEAVIKDLDFLKGIFASVVTSLIFLGVFMTIIPILTADSIEILAMGIVVIFFVIEVMFFYMVIVKVPPEEIWFRFRDKRKMGIITDTDKMLMMSMLAVVVGIAVMLILLIPLNLPLVLTVSTICMPVVLPGILFYIEEKKIMRRDNIYGAFIRALGRSSELSGQTMVESIRTLAMHKFGPLTSAIKNLAKRLSTRIDTLMAWNYFSAESSSNFINKFSEMYVHGTLNGSKPEPTSVFISNNMVKLLGIRTKRGILASSFMGVLYGIMVSLSITMWITVEIIRFMGDMATNLVAEGDDLSTFGFIENIFSATADIPTIQTVVLAMIVIHALFSSLMITKLRGGHILGAAMHFVALTWIGALSSYLVSTFMSGIL